MAGVPEITEEDGVTRVVERAVAVTTGTSRAISALPIFNDTDCVTAVYPWNRPQYIGQVKDSTHIPFYHSLPKRTRNKRR
jgi:hypothetical protein